MLIIWSDRYQDQWLEGSTIGLGGSEVRLDSNVTDPELTKLTLEHELGHVLGLGHVDDPKQLMHHTAGAKELGRGDIAGLKRLHDVPCT